MKTLVFEGEPVEVERRKMKYLRVRVVPPLGRLKVSAPNRTSDRVILEFLSANRAAIAAAQRPFLVNRTRRRLSWSEGDLIRIRGERFLLHFENAGRFSFGFDGGKLTVRMPLPAEEENRKKAVCRMLKEILLADAGRYASKWEPYLGVHAKNFRVREMTSRWGSCNTRTGDITLNLRLAMKKSIYLEYVVIHELCHLIVPGHTKDFWGHVASCIPDWNSRRRALNSDFEDYFSD